MRTTIASAMQTVLTAALALGAFSAVHARPQDPSAVAAIHDTLSYGGSCQAVTRFYLDRIARLDASAKLNAISMLNPRALAEAQSLDQRIAAGMALRPLECVPIVIKDNIDVAGLPTTAGSAALADNVASSDAEAVARLRGAGAVIIAKTNMAEWAFSPMRSISSTRGETANPFDPAYVPAGSSGGTASAVSAGFAAAGMGSDTGNSIRGPAAHTGLVGLRPGIGTLPLDGVVPLLAEYDAIGPMATKAADAAVMMDVLTRPVGEWTHAYRDALRPDAIRGRTFAVVTELAERADPRPDRESMRIFRAAVARLKADGARVVDVSIAALRPALAAVPDCRSFRHGVRRYLAGHSAALRDPAQAFTTGNFAPQSRDAFAYWVAEDGTCPSYEQDPARQAIAAALEQLMRDAGAEALIYPSWTFPPARRARAVEDYRGDNSQVLAPVSGLPAVSVPSGQYRSGLPAGLQLLGPRASEARLLGYAARFEAITAPVHPPIFDRYHGHPDRKRGGGTKR